MPLHESSLLPLRTEILWGNDCIASTAATVVDAMRTINMLAAMRETDAQPMKWRWTTLPGLGPGKSMAPPPAAEMGFEGEADLVLIPGWLAHSGPSLRETCSEMAPHWGPVLCSHVEVGRPVVAFFNGSALLAHLGLLTGRSVALPWAFAPSITWVGGDTVKWCRECSWQRDGPIWTTASLSDVLETWFAFLATTAWADLAQAAASVMRFDTMRQLTATDQMPSPSGTPTPTGSLALARRWLEANYRQPYNLQMTAKIANTSPRTLLRWFAQVYGQTPLDYLHCLRVNQAKTLLQTCYYSVDMVAQQCGYQDTASFRKIFTRVSGTTPSMYRKQFMVKTERRKWVADAATEPSVWHRRGG